MKKFLLFVMWLSGVTAIIGGTVYLYADAEISDDTYIRFHNDVSSKKDADVDAMVADAILDGYVSVYEHGTIRRFMEKQERGVQRVQDLQRVLVYNKKTREHKIAVQTFWAPFDKIECPELGGYNVSFDDNGKVIHATRVNSYGTVAGITENAKATLYPKFAGKSIRFYDDGRISYIRDDGIAKNGIHVDEYARDNGH